MTVRKETEESIEEIPEEFSTAVKEKYSEIEEFCDDAEHFENVVNELVLFEIVLGQINQIYSDTLYNKSSGTLIDAATQAVETLRISFSDEFVSQTLEKKELTSLPDLPLAISWITESHLNLIKQLFTEDYVREVMEPSYLKIAEAIVEVSGNQQENVEDIEVTLPGEEETPAS